MVIRLIDTATLRPSLYESDKDTPRYAILSHTWEYGKEVTLQELEELEVKEIKTPLRSIPDRDSYYYPAHPTRNRTGFAKIVECCRQARLRGLRYVWVDTCCIDKKDPTELGEAINSMFRWYQHAAECYVYLSDINLASISSRELGVEMNEPYNKDIKDKGENGILRGLQERFREILREKDNETTHAMDRAPASRAFYEPLARCRWFTRGWCLQELIAPLKMEFYDAEWHCLGSKQSLSGILFEITGISPSVLNLHQLDSIPVAVKMAWAARRQTTRVEDRAYCLLGMFNIYMPLLYGEGAHAFRRLQEEIIKRSDDLSIFAPLAIGMDNDGRVAHDLVPRDLFASGPEAFKNIKHIKKSKSQIGPGSFAMTNNGLHFTGAILKTNMKDQVFKLGLNHNAATSEGGELRGLQVLLKKVGPSKFVPMTSSRETMLKSAPDYKDITNDPEDIYIIGGAALGINTFSFTAQPYCLGFTTNKVNINHYPHLVKPIDPRSHWDLSGMAFLDIERNNNEGGFRTTVAIDIVEADSLLGLTKNEADKVSPSNAYVYLCCTYPLDQKRVPRTRLFHGEEWANLTGGREEGHTRNRIYQNHLAEGYETELQVGSMTVTAKFEDTGPRSGRRFRCIVHLGFEL